MPHRSEIALAALAAKQHGVVTRQQLLQLGFDDRAIYHRCRAGRWFRVHLGVYAVGRPPNSPLELASAAVLACGPGAALSHSSALYLWGFDGRWELPIHVTSREQRRRRGIVTHRAAGLTRADVRIQLGIRVTSPARTFLDCAPDLPKKRLARLAADARRSGHLHHGQILDVLARFPTHPGCRPLRSILEELESRTRSDLEDDFLGFCRQFGLPTPLVNVWVGGREADAFFPVERLIVEIDSWDFHRDRYSFEDDRDRDADTLAAGAATIRLTRERMTEAPRREAARLHTILGQRRC